MVVFRKIVLIVTMLVGLTVMMGWVPKEKVSRLMWFTASMMIVGFAWRVGSWYLSP